MAQELNFWKRLQADTPNFFKRVIALAITLAAVGAAILTAPTIIDGFVLPENIVKFSQWAIVAGIAAGVVGKTTVQK